MIKKLTGIHIKFFIPICVVLFAVAFALPSAVHGAESSCVKCHTSDQVLKSLHKPPGVTIEGGEG